MTSLRRPVHGDGSSGGHAAAECEQLAVLDLERLTSVIAAHQLATRVCRMRSDGLRAVAAQLEQHVVAKLPLLGGNAGTPIQQVTAWPGSPPEYRGGQHEHVRRGYCSRMIQINVDQAAGWCAEQETDIGRCSVEILFDRVERDTQRLPVSQHRPLSCVRQRDHGDAGLQECASCQKWCYHVILPALSAAPEYDRLAAPRQNAMSLSRSSGTGCVACAAGSGATWTAAAAGVCLTGATRNPWKFVLGTVPEPR